MTTVVGAQRREDLTLAALFALVPGCSSVQISRSGVVFDCELTAQQVSDVWWFITSRNDVDESARRNIASLRDAVASADLSTPEGLESLRALDLAVAAYLLGET